MSDAIDFSPKPPEGIATRDALAEQADRWIEAVAEGRDRDSFVHLFQVFAPRVTSYFIRRGVPRENADELAQETLLTVWRKAHLFDAARASAAAWIYTIARNLWIDAVRRERHPDDLRFRDLSAEPRTPEEELNTNEDASRVRAAMSALPFEQAEVLRMSHFLDLTHVQIAAALGLPLGTVKSRTRLATAHLASVLKDLA